MTMVETVCAFWSYAHVDDEGEEGRLSQLCGQFQLRLRQHTGHRDLSIFHDRKDINWGKHWKTVIDSGLQASTVLFPIITPSFLASPECLRELEAFRELETKTGRDDLILPLYYLQSPLIERPEILAKATENIRRAVELLKSRQFEDWRPLRHEILTGTSFSRAVDGLAQRAAGAFPIPGLGVPAASSIPKTTATSSVAEQVPVTRDTGAMLDVKPSVIHTVTVHPLPGRAKYHSINAAIKDAPAGARILLLPGTYREDVRIEKPVEIVGNGKAKEIIIESVLKGAIVIDVNMAQIRNITIHQRVGKSYAVWIKNGRAEIEDCDISSKGLAGIGISGTSDPIIRRNIIHDCSEGGVFFYEHARGYLEDNEIHSNNKSGIEVAGKSEPTIRRNKISSNNNSGIIITTEGTCNIEDNDIYSNSGGEVCVGNGSNPMFRRNRVHDGLQAGVLLYKQGRGLFEMNQIYNNKYSGVEIREDADPVFNNNNINKNLQRGLYVHKSGKGNYMNNDLTGNKRGAFLIDESSKHLVTMKGNKE